LISRRAFSGFELSPHLFLSELSQIAIFLPVTGRRTRVPCS
jgi:hypothetical protein